MVNNTVSHFIGILVIMTVEESADMVVDQKLVDWLAPPSVPLNIPSPSCTVFIKTAPLNNMGGISSTSNIIIGPADHVMSKDKLVGSRVAFKCCPEPVELVLS